MPRYCTATVSRPCATCRGPVAPGSAQWYSPTTGQAQHAACAAPAPAAALPAGLPSVQAAQAEYLAACRSAAAQW